MVETFQKSTYESTNSLKSQKLVSELVRKRYYETLETSVINTKQPSVLSVFLKN